MESRNLKLQAVVFDVYGTLLRVTPAATDAPERWDDLVGRTFGPSSAPDWRSLCRALESSIRREHEAARSVGIAYPEVDWRRLMRSVVPACAELDAETERRFLEAQAAIWHGIDLMPGVAGVLEWLRSRGVPLGIASNAQAYSRSELARALASAGRSSDDFEPDLCFWSYLHGFAKPDPHVFRLLGARLSVRGLDIGRVMMIGDRVDNDIRPAAAQGWLTWHLTGMPEASADPERRAGDWTAFRVWLEREAVGT